MARKSPALLKSAPVKLTKLSETVLADIRRTVVPPGTEEQFDRYLNAAIKHEEQYSRVEILSKSVKRSNDPNWIAFQVALKDYDKTHLALMGAIDAWLLTLTRLNQKVNVSNADLVAVIRDSLAEKRDDLDFGQGSLFMAKEIANTISENATEHEMGGPIPLCSDCR